jgi:hypothetical protein
MEVEEEAEKLASSENVLLVAKPTPQAIEEFNKFLEEKKKVAGVFHVTC